jgi:CSLREA domain-containing protein
MARLVLLALTLGALLGSPVHAALFRVNSVADDVDAAPGDGACATAGGACTLRAAVQEANALAGPDRIRVPAGTYPLTRTAVAAEDGAVTGDLDLRGRLRVIGAGENATIIDADAVSDGAFDVLGQARVTIAKLTVRNGYRPWGGGAIATATSSKTSLKRLVIESNAGEVGGGINALGPIRLTQSTVRNNAALIGGGLAVVPGSVVRDSTFDGNVAEGFAYFTGHDILASNPGTVTIQNSTITGQIETMGICQRDFDDQFECTGASDLVLENVTVNAVSAASLGPELGTFTVRNSIVEQCDAEVISAGYNLVADAGCTISGDATGVVVGQDPLLGPLADNGGRTRTRLPDALSPVLDAGNPATPGSGGGACAAADQRGVARPQGAACDLGAVEAARPTPTPVATPRFSCGVPNPGPTGCDHLR